MISTYLIEFLCSLSIGAGEALIIWGVLKMVGDGL